MRTAIDTNILSALWSNERGAQEILQQLGDARSLGALLIVPVVYAELLAYPKATEAFLDRFLSDTSITVDFHLDEPVWVDAGRRFARYAGHRRKSGSGEPKRLLADFLIGAMHCYRLMSLDPTPYKQYFPELKLV